MKKNKYGSIEAVGPAFFDKLWEKSWTYIKTVVDVVHEPVLILDKDLNVMAANESFYSTFQVNPKDTEGKLVYDLGNGQWKIPALERLLGSILSERTFFKGFQVAHEFPTIGRKVMILNARQIYIEDKGGVNESFPEIILLAMEDMTEMMVVADSIKGHTSLIEAKFLLQTHELETQIKQLEKEINTLKLSK